MAQYSNLKAYIEEKIYENGTQAITGDILQDVLKVMTDDLGEFYQMGGVASPSTDPGTPDAKVIYFATEAGTYTNFGGITIEAGEVALLIFETSWTKETLNVLSSANGGVKTANLADGAVTTEKIAGGAVETAKIANNAVTSGKVADGAIGTAKIADGAIDADKIAANAVESAKIKNGAVTEGKINDGAVTAGKVAANAVTTAKIADDAITTAKLNDGAVTEDKIATDAVTSGKVKDGAIGTAKIAAGAVTHAKIGAGAVEESNIKDGAVTSDKIANGAVGSDQLAEGAFSAENLADGSVTTDKLADEAVTAEKIADGAVTAGKFANGSVTTIKLGSGAVTTEKIGDGMVTRQKLADSSVGTSKIIDGAVTTDKVADGAITDAKLENPVSVSQNTQTGHTEIHIGNNDYPVASVEEVSQLGQNIYNIIDINTSSANEFDKFYLEKGATYIFENIGSYPCNLYTSDGISNIERINPQGQAFNVGDILEYTPDADSNFIHIVGFVTEATMNIRITKKTDVYNLNVFKEDASPFVYESTQVKALGAQTLPYKFKRGGVYVITNIGEYNTSVYSNDGTTNIDRAGTSSIAPGNSATLTATQDADYIRIVQSQSGEYKDLLISIKNPLSNYALFDSILELKDNFNPTTEVFTGTYANFPYAFEKSKTYLIANVGSNPARVYSYDGSANVEAVSLNPIPSDDYVIFKPKISADYIRLAGSNVEKTVAVTELNISALTDDYLTELTKGRPLETLKTDYALDDCSGDMVDGLLPINTLDVGGNYSVYPDMLIAKMDALVAAHPNDIVKEDLGATYQIAYPEYANLNGQASGNYAPTPSYKMWMYKITSYATANGYATAKKRLLITAGIHGWEMVGSCAAYHFAKHLLEDFLTDDVYYKMRAAFDIYIVPLVNGYGNYHLTRQNANGVNLNRNFYIGESHTELHPFDFDYPGEEGLSEFESKVIVALGNDIKPDAVFDLHTNVSYPFYTELFAEKFEKSLLKLSYQSLTEVSYILKKHYAEYFGEGYEVVKNNAAPTFISSTPGTLARWFVDGGATLKLPFTAILEVSGAINYQNGSFIPIDQPGLRTYRIEPITIAEYVIRNQLIRYCDFILNIATKDGN